MRDNIVRAFAIAAFVIALAPLPFSDLIWLMPLQLILALAIVLKSKSHRVLKALAVLVLTPTISVAFHTATLFAANLIPIVGKFLGSLLPALFTLAVGTLAKSVAG